MNIEGSGVTINGNVGADRADEVYIGTFLGPTIFGNIKITRSTGDITVDNSDINRNSAGHGGNVEITKQSSGDIFVTNNGVEGSVDVSFNRGCGIVIGDNFVDGDILVNHNRLAPLTVCGPTIAISDNTVGADSVLDCNKNDPAPTGSGNSPAANLKGQCAGLNI